jgi:uroporphyrin-III C-methyltransferase
VTVYLVGAGPGDPDLITVRGARLLATAGVVVHDRLAAPVLELVNQRAELIDVGKVPGVALIDQDEINRLLVHHGRRHEIVVRLKGGDPFVFARGGEEMAALHAAGVPTEVVPGISSVLAAPAVAGIPLTMRTVASSFTVLSGHEDPALVSPERWRSLVSLGGTIVVVMGARTIEAIAGALVAAGLPATTPVAAVHSATTGDEVVAYSTLAEVGPLALAAPVVFVIGEVARQDPAAAGARPDDSQKFRPNAVSSRRRRTVVPRPARPRASVTSG